MSIRNLDSLFSPGSVVLVGASPTSGTLGSVVAQNLLSGGFPGKILFVNPKHDSVLGHPCVRDIDRLESAPDLAIIVTPPTTVPGLVGKLAARGTRGAIVISAGFGGNEGTLLKQAMRDAAKPHLMRILGPNCVGLIRPGLGLNASFAHLLPAAGSIALLAQSGAILTSVIDWAAPRNIGFSHLVSMGEMTDIDFGDMLDYLAVDRSVSAILIYAEAFTNARKFVSAARRAARLKPVIAIKAGRYQATAGAVVSHTGALAGSDAVYDAVFRRVGMLRVGDLNELFESAETLATATPPAGDRLAILTNGGGLGILAADALVAAGGRLAALQPQTLARLDAVLPAIWSRSNPVDIIGDATAGRYEAALRPLLDDPGNDAVLVLNCPTAVTPGIDAARSIAAAAAGSAKCILAGWIGDQTARLARQHLAAVGLPCYETPEQGVRAFMNLVRYRHNQTLLAETPPSVPAEFTPDIPAARAIIDVALADGRDVLTMPEAIAVLAAYRIPVARSIVAGSPAEAGTAARRIGGPVALKLLSPDITHKSDVGGVVLDLNAPEDVEAAAEKMLRHVAALQPQAHIEGFTVSQMVDRRDGYELIIGATEDPLFGPVLMFGQGGIAVEVVADRCFALPPLNMKLAGELVAGTRIHQMLRGFRSQPPVALADLQLALVKVSQLVVDFAEIAELDINPILAGPSGVIALDARIRIRRASGIPSARLAIRPYPRELEEQVTSTGGERYLLRPIRPEDEPALVSAFRKLSPETVRLRFLAPISSMSHDLAARLTQIDYDREMALVLTASAPSGTEEIFGVVRLSMDPDKTTAEFAIVVRDDVAGRGLGTILMQRILAYGRSVGLRTIDGDVLAGNEPMLALCRQMGFRCEADPEMPSVVHVTKDLALA